MRTALSGLCGLLAALLLPVALVAVWLHTVVADTDGYLARVEPLAAEQRVRDAVEDLLIDGLRGEVGPLLGETGTDAAGAEVVVRQVVTVAVGSDAFTGLWSTAQRTGHGEVVSVLSSPDPLRTGEPVVVPLDVFVDAFEEQLAELGLPVPDRVEGRSIALPLTSPEDLEPARVAYRVLEPLWLVLPVAAVALALLSVVLARRRLRALAVLGGLASLGCLGLLASLGPAREVLLGTSPSPSAAVLTGRIADAVTADLRGAAVTGVLLGLAVVVVATALGLGVRVLRRTAG